MGMVLEGETKGAPREVLKVEEPIRRECQAVDLL